VALFLKIRSSLFALICCSAASLFLPASLASAGTDEPTSDSVGVIEGEAISVTGPVLMESVGGHVRTTLRSGSEISVKYGTARIDLMEGGQLSICGPAHLSLLKSGGSLTVAIDTGTIHVFIPRDSGLNLYTPQIQAHPISIGGGPLETLVGFAPTGEMCIRAIRGAIRIEQQLTGQSVIIPQAGDILLTNGQIDSLRSAASPCSCELQEVSGAPSTRVEVSQIATAEEIKKAAPSRENTSPSEVKPEPKEEPVYQVFMPPLIYDAKAKVQPEIDPRTIILVRRVRIRSKLIFQGRVEGEPINTASAAPPPAASPTSSASPAGQQKASPQPAPSLFDRMRDYVRKLWSRGS
jgi:hypothetical protein